jgi:uncharacterized protein (DUF1501 family)
MDRMTRRRFLRALSTGGAVYALGRTPGTVWAQSAAVNGFSDYKALVCVYLTGGNDSWSMVVPRSAPEYVAYAQARQNLAIAQDALLPVDEINGGAALYGFHPSMPGVRSLFQSGSCAVVANVGPLIEPVTKAQYQQGIARLPPQLFSHNDQTRQWCTLRGRRQLRSGWAGRIADALAGDLSGQQLATNVSLSGNTVFQAGQVATPYIMGATGAKEFTGFGSTGPNLERRLAFERLAAASYNSIYERSFADVHQRAALYAKRVNDALEAAPAFSTGFSAQSSLATQLKTVAKMIAVRDRLGMARQIFYVGIGGYDTHDDQLLNQPGLLGDLSQSLAAFHAATVQLGVAQNVTTFTQSDFGRSLTSNGDGSDHAWGGLQLVVGGSVTGQTIYGQYPLLQIGSNLDVGGGRLIPSISADQYAATLARWFGVPEAQMSLIAPNLVNFAQHDLGFMA